MHSEIIFAGSGTGPGGPIHVAEEKEEEEMAVDNTFVCCNNLLSVKMRESDIDFLSTTIFSTVTVVYE
jgi:hypothetical protein